MRYCSKPCWTCCGSRIVNSDGTINLNGLNASLRLILLTAIDNTQDCGVCSACTTPCVGIIRILYPDEVSSHFGRLVAQVVSGPDEQIFIGRVVACNPITLGANDVAKRLAVTGG